MWSLNLERLLFTTLSFEGYINAVKYSHVVKNENDDEVLPID